MSLQIRLVNKYLLKLMSKCINTTAWLKLFLHREMHIPPDEICSKAGAFLYSHSEKFYITS